MSECYLSDSCGGSRTFGSLYLGANPLDPDGGLSSLGRDVHRRHRTPIIYRSVLSVQAP